MNIRNVRFLFGLTIAMAIAIILFARAPRVQADSEVTDCTEAGLDTAPIGGGTITFNCNGTHAPATIYFASTLTLSGTVTLDGSNGGNTVALDGVFARRIFSVTVGSQLTLLNLILQNGDDADGGCLYANGAVMLNHVEAWNCQAFGGKRGGVLFVNSTGSATLVNSRLHDNLAGRSHPARRLMPFPSAQTAVAPSSPRISAARHDPTPSTASATLARWRRARTCDYGYHSSCIERCADNAPITTHDYSLRADWVTLARTNEQMNEAGSVSKE